MSFTAASLAAARAVRDAFTVVVEVIDALIPAEAIDQAEALAKAEEEREVWEPHDFAACGGDADAGSSHPTSAPSAKQDTAPHTDSAAAPHRGTPGGETPRSAAGRPDPSPASMGTQCGEGPGADSSIPSGAAPGRPTSLDLFTASGVVAIYATQVDDEATQAYLDRLSDLLAMAAADIAESEQ